MTWPTGIVPGVGLSQIIKGRADDHVPRPLPPQRRRQKTAEEVAHRRERVRESHRNYMTRKRAQCRAEGICITCLKREVKPGCVSCQRCIDAMVERNDRVRAEKKAAKEAGNTNGAQRARGDR